jgi:hypothetical protein
MTESRGREAWNHTATVLALLANCHRAPKHHRPFTPQDFHPLHNKEPATQPCSDLSILKDVFVDRRMPEKMS